MSLKKKKKKKKRKSKNKKRNLKKNKKIMLCLPQHKLKNYFKVKNFS